MRSAAPITIALAAVLGLSVRAGLHERTASHAPPTDPPAPGSTAIACHPEEPGPRLLIAGRVRTLEGRPIPGATVVAYNTDATGLYNTPESGSRIPRLRASVTTDIDGRFQILTVVPGPYPNTQDPAHVHFETLAPGYALRYTTIWFEGDPRVTPESQAQARQYERIHPNDLTFTVPITTDARGVKVVEHEVKLETN